MRCQDELHAWFLLSGETSSQVSLTSHIRAGKLRPMLELGITPSHVSIAVDSKSEDGQHGEGGDTEKEGEGNGEGEGQVEVYCVPLESLGLGGNLIGNSGAKSLAQGLVSNTSELLSVCIACAQCTYCIAGYSRGCKFCENLVMSVFS